MLLKHHGAIDGVTGSCHQVFVDNYNSLLIDCGLFQGDESSGKGSSFNKLEIDFDITTVRALLVTHCHIDHIGRIPYLLAAGFKEKIYCSEPTAKLLPLVLEDAIKIGFTRNKSLVNKFLTLIKNLIQPIPYNKWTEIKLTGKSTGLFVRFQRAGHIIGSAFIECKVVSTGNSSKKVLFSGDLGAPYTPLLPSPKPPWSTDVLVIESTYGNHIHEGRKNRKRELKEIISRAFRNGGVVLIPAFSIGRTQELLYDIEDIIHRFSNEKAFGKIEWSDIDIIVDSPLASRFTNVYRELKSFWDRESKRKIRSGRHPLSFEQMLTVDSHESHLDTISYLLKSKRPAIIIAASGMCTGGRVVNYLKAFISDPKTDILFSGYQSKGTPGRIIQKYGSGRGYVELDGERFTINASIHTLSGYSAHADQRNLLSFIRGMRKKPGEIRVVHGDDDAKEALKNKIESLYPDIHVLVPSQRKEE